MSNIQHQRTNAGFIPNKYRELMALTIAFTKQCPYCIELYTRRAHEASASAVEIAEASDIADVVRAGVAITHGAHSIT